VCVDIISGSSSCNVYKTITILYIKSQTCYLGTVYWPEVAADEDKGLLTFRKKHTQVVISFTLITLWCKHHLAENNHVEKATDMTQNTE